MSDFLAELLEEGRIGFRSGNAPLTGPSADDLARLAGEFATASLSMAGPAVGFEPRVAWEAAELVHGEAWALVNRGERPEALRHRLRMPGTPTTASEHFSADLLLRYLPQILRRARGLDPTDPLAEILAESLRRWPLSGVLSDVEEPPVGPLDFGDHPGLMLLYAERLASNDRPGWRPSASSRILDYYELVTGSIPTS